MTKKTYTLDIFATLKQVDRKNGAFYSSLSSEEQKALQPLVAMRWLTGTSDHVQTYAINEFVNPYVFSLHQHKELLFKLMVASSSGRVSRYKWMKGGKKTTNLPAIVTLLKNYYNYSTKHVEDVIPLHTDEQILEIAQDLGLQKEELTSIKKELKQRA